MKELVYFIKHKGLTPIKVGKSTKEAFKGRLGQFKTSSPYGIEIIGVIETNDAYKLENLLHRRFKAFRLNGEWFEISEDVVNGLLLQYQDKDFIDAKNDFIMDYHNLNTEDKSFDIIEDLKKNHKGKVLRQREIIALYTELSIEEIKKQLKNAGMRIKCHNVKGNYIQGYKII